MPKHKHRPWQKAQRAILVAMATIGGAIVLTACAVPQQARKAAPAMVEQRVQAPREYRSDAYVLVELDGSETARTLASKYLGDPNKAWVIEAANEATAFETGRMIVIPLKPTNKGGIRADGYQTVPILNYHRFAVKCRSSLCLPADVFETHLKYLHDNGYRSIRLEELSEFVRYRKALPEKAVMITIDDGYRSAYEHAYPLLRQYGFSAVLFIYTDFAGVGESALTWDQIRQMQADGIEVGSHTLSHCDLAAPKPGEDHKAYVERIRKELMDSKKIIDKRLGQNTIAIAYPYGTFNDPVAKMTEDAGYTIAFSVQAGEVAFFSDPFGLPRNQVIQRDMETFRRGVKTFNKMPLRQ